MFVTTSIKKYLSERLADKAYRDAFVSSHLATNIAAQISSMREDRAWTQTGLAERTEMAQGRISLLEDPSYEQITISTLKRLASAFDVALVVRFVSFGELVVWVANLTPEKLAVPDFAHDSLHEWAPERIFPDIEHIKAPLTMARPPTTFNEHMKPDLKKAQTGVTSGDIFEYAVAQPLQPPSRPSTPPL